MELPFIQCRHLTKRYHKGSTVVTPLEALDLEVARAEFMALMGPSGSGKTTITLSLLRVLKRHGIEVSSLKVGPDYIDPAFHTAASSRTCLNLDLWAMRPDTATAVIDQAAEGAELLVAEGVMGLFDGAVTDEGSTADVASLTGWPVVLVVDAQGMAASAAALVRGFATHRADVQIAGVIFNRIGSERHLVMLERAMEPLGIPVFGALMVIYAAPFDKVFGRLLAWRSKGRLEL